MALGGRSSMGGKVPREDCWCDYDRFGVADDVFVLQILNVWKCWER